MYTKPWELTDQEIAKVDESGGSRYQARKAKKQAYIRAGGVILNPDALKDMYEAVKQALRTFEAHGITETDPRYIILKQARDKAEGK
ncbi:hypothetical protein LCGC14_0801690 [marine sediment metagenome]|uniref:Uncharacterized protein n=1 Tax=marine sediment metagenome TaxID=412755 RepID=A0A0F9S9D4_9ZZZZ